MMATKKQHFITRVCSVCEDEIQIDKKSEVYTDGEDGFFICPLCAAEDDDFDDYDDEFGDYDDEVNDE